jgi:hypothetical protein
MLLFPTTNKCQGALVCTSGHFFITDVQRIVTQNLNESDLYLFE